MDDALAGTRVLIAGGEGDAARALGARLATGAAQVTVALGAAEAELRELLDPLDLRTGPPLVPAADLDRPEDDENRATVRRLRSLLDRAARLGARLDLSELAVTHIRHAAPLHDVGKIAIPDSILLKPGRLSAQEFEVVKTHAEAGARVLADAESEVLEVAESIARSHHERWDGSGYPGSLAGADIPLVGRLVHVADVFDILVHERPYKEALSVEAAAAEITGGAGTQFDPEVVEAFTDLGRRAWLAAPGVYGG